MKKSKNLYDIYKCELDNIGTKEEQLYQFLAAYCNADICDDVNDAIKEYKQHISQETLENVKIAISEFLSRKDFSKEEKEELIFDLTYGFCSEEDAIEWLKNVQKKL